jgi:formate dehydrogenase subunit delta
MRSTRPPRPSKAFVSTVEPSGADAVHAGAGHGTAAHLLKMANDIGNFFRSEPVHQEAVAGIANHIAKFWTPRMRQKLMAHVQAHGDAELDPLPREALASLAAQAPATPKPREPPGGDAG